MSWSKDELDRIDAADDLKIAPLRSADGPLGTPTWIWCVQVEGGLFVRAYHGVRSGWHQSALRWKAGQIIAAGMTRDVTFEPVADGGLNDRIDAAYTAKYKGSPYVAHMVAAGARAATVKILLIGEAA